MYKQWVHLQLNNSYSKLKKLGYFGSYAVGEQKLDIVVELKYYLKAILVIPVALVTTRALKPQGKEIIIHEIIYA